MTYGDVFKVFIALNDALTATNYHGFTAEVVLNPAAAGSVVAKLIIDMVHRAVPPPNTGNTTAVGGGDPIESFCMPEGRVLIDSTATL